jgi:hypothetical protein
METKIIQHLFEGAGSIIAILFSFFIYFWILKKIFPSRKRKETDIMNEPKRFWRDSLNITLNYIRLRLNFYILFPIIILIILLLLIYF